MNLLTMMKALPLAYNHDMQEDKEPLFDTIEVVKNSLIIMSGIIGSFQINPKNIERSLKEDFSSATELADYLVKKGIPFREAHEVVGKIVLYCIDHKKNLEQLNLAELQHFQPLFEEDILNLLSPEAVVNSKKSYGGTALARLNEAITEAEEILNHWRNDDGYQYPNSLN
jgi:argininosuccinate lyase